MNNISNERFEETKNRILELNTINQNAENKLQTIVDKLKSTESGKRFPIPIEFIELNMNPRGKTIDENDSEFLQLVESIKEVGVLQCPVVTVIDNKIVPLLGHRRIAATQYLKQKTIVCEIKHFQEEIKNQLSALIENTARKNWDLLAIGKSLSELSTKGYTQIKLGELLGKDRNTIGRMIKIANWGSEIHDIIRNNHVKLNTKVLLNIASRDLNEIQIIGELRKIIEKKLNSSPTHEKNFRTNEKNINMKIDQYFEENPNVNRDNKLLIINILKYLNFI